MRKTYRLIFALVLFALNAVVANAGKADLDPAMFKAWDSNLPGANVVAEPDPEPKSSNPFGCTFALYENLAGGATIYGSPNVYCMWYADITGTNTMTVTGTPGMGIRLMINRVPFEEGGVGDADGGAYVEWIQYVGDNGQVVFDFTTKEEIKEAGYIHLNAIKVPNGSPSGTVKAIELEGTVKPATGWVDILTNGDAEGDDVHSFFEATNAVEDKGYHPAKIVAGAGVNGSNAYVVESMDSPSETWQTQFFIAFDEPLPEGTQWRLTMDIKADKYADCGSGVHHAPREYFNGSLFDPNPTFGTDWQTFEYSGTLDAAHAQDPGLGSIAFDLNTLGEANKYYFDNVHFEVYKESTPISLISAGFASDVLRIDFGKQTNLNTLIKNAGGQRVVYPTDCVKVKVNGEDAGLMSVEGRPDGYLWIFIDEESPYAETEDDEIIVSFTNPEDPNFQIIYTAGKYQDEPVPSFTDMKAVYADGIDEQYSYLWSTPSIVSANPEDGSFNLPLDLKEFKFTFDHNLDCAALKATMGNEVLTVSPAEGYSKEITLTRGSGNMQPGVITLNLNNVKGERDLGETGDYELKYSFGPIQSDEQPAVIYTSNFTQNGEEGAEGAGWMTRADNSAGMQPANSGGGSRLQHGQTGYAADVLYLAQRSADAGIALYGTEEGYKLTLEGGKTYHLTLKSAQWDAYDDNNDPNRTLRVQVLTEEAVSAEDGSILDESGILADQIQKVYGRVKENKDFTEFDVPFKPAEDGNFVIRLVAGNLDGNPGGYGDGNAIADVKVEYIPDVLGIAETALLNKALNNAKTVRDDNADERFDGTAFTELSSAITTVEALMPSLTAPSVYKALAAELDNYANTMKKHRNLCDTYDPLPGKAYTISVDYAETKFASTQAFKDVVAAALTYCTKSKETQIDPETGEPTEVEVVTAKVLKDDAELTAAIELLQNKTNVASNMFTEGVSQNGDAGIKVLVDRLRQGANSLKESFGAADDDILVVEVNNALTDDDLLAAKIKNRITSELYNKLKDPANKVFDPVVDDETGEETIPTIDMTVFIKNPNTYALLPSNGVNPENTPGWEQVSTGNMGLYGAGGSSWGSPRNIEGLPEDCAFTVYHSDARVEQTITDLPAGIYNLTWYGTDWGNMKGDDGTGPDALGFVYAKLKNTPAPVEGEAEDREVNFASTVTAEFAGQYAMNKAHTIEGLEITDGFLTIGVQTGNDSQYFFGDVKLTLVAPATGFDYGKAYEDFLNGIESISASDVREVQYFDLNGRRITNAHKGMVIVKKIMNDGSVKNIKVLK